MGPENTLKISANVAKRTTNINQEFAFGGSVSGVKSEVFTKIVYFSYELRSMFCGSRRPPGDGLGGWRSLQVACVHERAPRPAVAGYRSTHPERTGRQAHLSPSLQILFCPLPSSARKNQGQAGG